MSKKLDCDCPKLRKEDWELKKLEWPRRAFYVAKHYVFLHIPIGIGGAIEKGMNGIEEKGYKIDPLYMMLDDETGVFTANMMIAINNLPEDDPDVEIWEPTTVYSKFYHGKFKGLKGEIEELKQFYKQETGDKPDRILTWTSNCPECWDRDGGPTVVLFAI